MKKNLSIFFITFFGIHICSDFFHLFNIFLTQVLISYWLVGHLQILIHLIIFHHYYFVYEQIGIGSMNKFYVKQIKTHPKLNIRNEILINGIYEL